MSQNTNNSFLVAKGLATALILLAIVTPIMLVVIGILFAIFSNDNPIADFVSDHTTLVAALVVFAVIITTIWLIGFIDRKFVKKSSR